MPTTKNGKSALDSLWEVNYVRGRHNQEKIVQVKEEHFSDFCY
jgi:hypothetical protein